MTQLTIKAARFKIGQFVRKCTGSWWEGVIVGMYRTEATPIGYCVQAISDDNGPVQLYPESALERVKQTDPSRHQMALITKYLESGKLTNVQIASRVGVSVYQVDKVSNPAYIAQRAIDRRDAYRRKVSSHPVAHG